jgi:hypothetical protein
MPGEIRGVREQKEPNQQRHAENVRTAGEFCASVAMRTHGQDVVVGIVVANPCW